MQVQFSPRMTAEYDKQIKRASSAATVQISIISDTNAIYMEVLLKIHAQAEAFKSIDSNKIKIRIYLQSSR